MQFTKNGENIKQIGYGAMVLEGYYGASDDKLAVDTLVHAINNNMMIDSADAYGAGHNEDLIKQAIAKADKEAFVATKFGIVFDENETGTLVDTGWGFPLKINGRPEYVKKAIDNSLQRFGVETIDLMYAHYLDPEVPVEETVGAMSEAMKEGKIQAIGLSNVTVEDIRRASKIEKISAVQYEYSLARREAEDEILPIINEIGASLVAWSPLANGILTGNISSIPEGDFRNNNPKYQGENFKANLKLIEQLKSIAEAMNINLSTLALAWLVNKGDNIIPIPGSRKISRIDDNIKALDVKISDEAMTLLDLAVPIGAFKGATLV